MVHLGIPFQQGVQVWSGFRRNIGIVVMNVVPVHGFQNQQHHPVVGRLLPGHRFRFGIDAQLGQGFLILVRQGPFRILPGLLDHLIRLEQGLAHKFTLMG